MEEEFPISSVTVEITTRIDTHDDRELSTSFSGTINVMDDDGEDVCIGKIKMDRLEVYEAKLHKGRCVIDAADEISQPMYDAAERLVSAIQTMTGSMPTSSKPFQVLWT
jgi:hypothetical protein